jgi:Ca-activated chloride channel homolog
MMHSTWRARGLRALALFIVPTLGTLAGAGCSTDAEGDGALQGSGGTDGGHSASDTGTSASGTGASSGDDPSDSGWSTGGTTGDGDWTGDDPDDGEQHGTTGEQDECDDQSPVVLYLSPDDSNSMSSPVQARDAIRDGWGLGGVPIRTWEFMNYYGFDYPVAAPGALALFVSALHDEGMADGEYKLQIAVSSPEVSNDDRAPMNVTLVLDESGSMSGAPMSMLKESGLALAASLRSGDIVSMVTWDTSNAVVLSGHEVTGPSDPTLVSAIQALAPGGGTDLHGGLVAGYELAAQSYDPGRINRIVLVSDGGANVGVTDAELIAQHAGSNDQDGIYMVGVGVGTYQSYNDHLMDTVTDLGKGASVFISSESDAWKTFNQDFVNTMAVAARDVRVRLDLPPGFEIVRFSGEEYSADPSEVEPQHLAPNDAMVFHQTIATCAPELATEDAPVAVSARYKDPLTFDEHEIAGTFTLGELLAEDPTLLLKGAAVFAYAEGLKALRDQGGPQALDEALAAVARAQDALPEDPDLEEISDLLTTLAAGN